MYETKVVIEKVLKHAHQVGEQVKRHPGDEWETIVEVKSYNPEAYHRAGEAVYVTDQHPGGYWVSALDHDEECQWRVKPEPFPELWINYYEPPPFTRGGEQLANNFGRVKDTERFARYATYKRHYVRTLHVKPDGTVEWVQL